MTYSSTDYQTDVSNCLQDCGLADFSQVGDDDAGAESAVVERAIQRMKGALQAIQSYVTANPSTFSPEPRAFLTEQCTAGLACEKWMPEWENNGAEWGMLLRGWSLVYHINDRLLTLIDDDATVIGSHIDCADFDDAKLKAETLALLIPH